MFLNKNLNHAQLTSKCSNYFQELRKSRLEIMNLQGKVNRIGETLSMHQRFLVSISQNNVPRLKELVAVALRHNRSINYIVGKVVDAVDMIYKARPSESDKDLALLILEFGGPSLLDICHKANALPSCSTAYRMRKNSCDISTNIGTPAAHCLRSNTNYNAEHSSYAYSIKADETYVTPRLRYDSKYDLVQGLCHEHGIPYKNFHSYEEANLLSEAVKAERVHVPKEVTLVGGCSLNNTLATDVICAWPTCDKNNYNQSFVMFQSLANEYYKITGKPPMNFSTDGDSTRRQVFNSLLSHELDSTSSLGAILSGIPLVDILCGVHNETVSYDPKHLSKRCWTSFTKESVCLGGMIVKITDLQSLFSLLPESNNLEIDALLFPKDKQNVPNATKFLLMFIDAMHDVPESTFPYRLLPIHKGLVMLANVFEGLLSFYVDTQIDVKKQIVQISIATHSLFYIYRAYSTKVLPNQLYHDLQSTFIDALFCFAKAKLFFPDKPLYLVLNGTDPLERIFGVLRMKVKNASMDYLTLVHCIGSMLRCDEILIMKHPDWSTKSRTSRRLCLDYSNPRMWDAEKLKLADADISSLWESGHMKARSDALEYGLVKSSETVQSLSMLGSTLKKPRGKLIGVHEVDPDESLLDSSPSTDEDSVEPEESIPLSDLMEKSATIEIDGKNIYKASVINSMFSSNGLSKDRLKRVQGLTSGSPGQSIGLSDEQSQQTIFIGDPLLVHFDNKPNVANIHKISLGNQPKKFLKIEEMKKPNLSFEVRLLKLVENDGNRLFWDGSTVGNVINVTGDKCVVIKPSICPNPPDSLSHFYYNKQFLLDIGIEFTMSENQSSQSRNDSCSSVKKNKCKVCSKMITCDKMRGHVGYHILNGEIDSNVCGFCSMQTCSNKLKQSSKTKSAKYYQIESSCPYFYSYGRKPKYSNRQKCSNYLARCEVTNCNADIWKYAMANHYHECHRELVVPESFLVSSKEKATIICYKI